ncbi:hypothetical protein [Streptomyces coelicoflavus]|uniref:hypothetical protein n=1 Tax=Streptomyces coelicoflavus TaxID=285562 RepID=UPI002E255CE1
MTGGANADKSTTRLARHKHHGFGARRRYGTRSPRSPRSPPEGDGMANKIEIRPLDKKETTGDSGGNGGS